MATAIGAIIVVLSSGCVGQGPTDPEPYLPNAPMFMSIREACGEAQVAINGYASALDGVFNAGAFNSLYDALEGFVTMSRHVQPRVQKTDDELSNNFALLRAGALNMQTTVQVVLDEADLSLMSGDPDDTFKNAVEAIVTRCEQAGVVLEYVN